MARIEIRKYYNCWADNMKEANEKIESIETVWTEAFEIINWGDELKEKKNDKHQ